MPVQLKRSLSGLAGLVLDQVLPRRCGVCGSIGTLLCDACKEALFRVKPPRCATCWGRIGAERCPRCVAYGAACEAIRAPFVYGGGARRLVTRVKYAGLHALAGEMGALMASAWITYGFDVDVVTAVPLYPRRQRERGFNQSALLAKRIAPELDLPYSDRLVRRRRATLPQARTQDEDERRSNMLGAFEPLGEAALGPRVLLIDDVVTTRATLGACATALLDGGAEAVYGLAFAVAD
ncbi:MAG: ComF family protein [Dehalococcoidia bacterium]